MQDNLQQGSYNRVDFFYERRRYCIREEHIVHHAGGKKQNEWIFHYNDGTEESVTGAWL